MGSNPARVLSFSLFFLRRRRHSHFDDSSITPFLNATANSFFGAPHRKEALTESSENLQWIFVRRFRRRKEVGGVDKYSAPPSAASIRIRHPDYGQNLASFERKVRVTGTRTRLERLL